MSSVDMTTSAAVAIRPRRCWRRYPHRRSNVAFVFFGRTFSPMKRAPGPPPLGCAIDHCPALDLRLVDIPVDRAGFHQIGVRSFGDHASLIEHEDLVRA